MRLVKYNLVCPACNHEFQRKFKSESVTKGTTSCIKCRVVFKRIEFYPDSEIAKIKDAQKRYDILNKLPINPSIVKGDQVPNSLTETKFKAKAIEKGWKPHRPSWPDFMVETEKGLIFVEVKSRSDVVRPSQFLTFNLLESHGFKVFIWHDVKGARENLIPWRKWGCFISELNENRDIKKLERKNFKGLNNG